MYTYRVVVMGMVMFLFDRWGNVGLDLEEGDKVIELGLFLGFVSGRSEFRFGFLDVSSCRCRLG